MAVLDKVTDFLLFLGKLVVTAAVALLSFFYFSGGINTTEVSCSANCKPLHEQEWNRKTKFL